MEVGEMYPRTVVCLHTCARVKCNRGLWWYHTRVWMGRRVGELLAHIDLCSHFAYVCEDYGGWVDCGGGWAAVNCAMGTRVRRVEGLWRAGELCALA